MVHKHSVRDVGARFLIDQFTRQIKNDSANKTTIVQYDHNSERLTFEIPLYVDGHAMTLCDLIEIHYINISTDGKSQNHGTYEVKDIKAEGENAVFTWLISQECTQLAGSLNFFIVFKCTENGVTVYRWGTEIYKNLAISAGMDNGEAVLTQYPDILAQWKAQIFDANNTAVSNVATAEANALAAIEAAGEAKKQSVLDSIPDEYEALSELANQNHKTKAAAIVVNVEGESIAIKDASEYPLQNLKLFGKSTQDGTPTPDAPIAIVSVENPMVAVFGKNLFNLPQMIEKPTSNYNYDLFTNTAGQSTPVPVEKLSLLPYVEAGKTYFFSCEIPELAVAAGVKVMAVNDDGTIGDESGTAIAILAVNSGAFVPTKSSFATVRVGTAEAVTIRNVQLEMGETATEYETPAITQTVETSHTLPGIPVSGGGNYTDENGQQWICDEVDLARGVYTQRIGSKVFDGSSDEIWHSDSLVLDNTIMFRMEISDSVNVGNVVGLDFLCTHFEAKNMYNADTTGSQHTMKQFYFRLPKTVLPSEDVDGFRAMLSAYPMTVNYVLNAPIETPLSDAEINAFKALHSNKPVTTILNDSGACMAVEYVADTKTYIDNKITKMMEGVTA